MSFDKNTIIFDIYKQIIILQRRHTELMKKIKGTKKKSGKPTIRVLTEKQKNNYKNNDKELPMIEKKLELLGVDIYSKGTKYIYIPLKIYILDKYLSILNKIEFNSPENKAKFSLITRLLFEKFIKESFDLREDNDFFLKKKGNSLNKDLPSYYNEENITKYLNESLLRFKIYNCIEFEHIEPETKLSNEKDFLPEKDENIVNIIFKSLSKDDLIDTIILNISRSPNISDIKCKDTRIRNRVGKINKKSINKKSINKKSKKKSKKKVKK